MWVLPCKLTAEKSSNSLRSPLRFIVTASLVCLRNAKKIRVAHEKIEKDKGKHQQIYPR